MNKTIEDVVVALDELSSAIKNGWTDERTLIEVWGNFNPPFDRHELAQFPRNLSEVLRGLNPEPINNDTELELKKLPKKISLFMQHSVQHFYNGNGGYAFSSLHNLLETIRLLLQPVYGWEKILDHKMMPTQLSRRLKTVHSDLSEILTEKEKLKEDIHLIRNAREAADSLPVDLQELREARVKVEDYSKQASSLYDKIADLQKKSEQAESSAARHQREAESLVSKCQEAYRITTTIGLAAAFDERAKKLNGSIGWWVIGLLCALGSAILIGYFRLQLLNTTLTPKDTNWGLISVQLVLSFLSVGAPLWFAWLATKQIGQRFKLSEDYAFKASVAKAYEGYRKEAKQIDEELEERLFASALQRLEEAPLRLLEKEPHGSPWHELIMSPEFQNASEELKKNFMNLMKKGEAFKKVNITKDEQEKRAAES
jgi:hypothetical protein